VERVEDLHDDALAAALELLDGLGAAVGADEDVATPPPGGSTTSSLPGRCCRNEHAFHTVSSSAGYCENLEMRPPLFVVEVSMQSTVPTVPAVLTPLYSSAISLDIVVLMKALSVKPQLAANAATLSPPSPRYRWVLGSSAARPCSFLTADASAWIVLVNLWPLRLTHATISFFFHCAQNSSDLNSMPSPTAPQKPKPRMMALYRTNKGPV